MAHRLTPYWLGTPDDLKRHKNNIRLIYRTAIEDGKEAMGLTDYAALSRYRGDLEPVTEFVVFRPEPPAEA